MFIKIEICLTVLKIAIKRVQMVGEKMWYNIIVKKSSGNTYNN